ncbi:MAG: XRE family transcriptional regulator [Actinomycetota bacterium]|nr:XRE family transcriptional regulator [Actinomycetota bacterium]
MTTVNDQLRAARERTASLVYPDEGLSREELADLVNAYIWDHHHKRVALDAGYLGKLERGIIRWPAKLYREALRAILGVPTDTALGFVNARRAVVKLEDVHRKKFLRTTAVGLGTLALAPVAALLEGSEPTPIPARVGATEITQIRTAARVFESWDFAYGGGLAREAVLAQLRWSAGMLEATFPARLRSKLFSAVGDLAVVAGFMAFDAHADDEAHRVFRFALGCAEQADDWHLRATVLMGMAAQAIETGRPDEGLTLIDHALVRADRLTATERAMLNTTRAHALAPMRRVRETLIAVGTADDHLAHSTPANDPPFMAFYNAVRHDGSTGAALAGLAPTGHSVTEAASRLSTAISGHGPASARAKAIFEIKLASLTMATGDPVQAAVIGTTALDAAGALRSRRILDVLRELGRHAAAHQRLGEVAQLRHRIGTLVLAS